MIKHKTSDVFGISRELPLNYVTRPSADDFLVNNLTRDKHIVIYGSSKQGKTSLRKHCLADNDYIVVHCSNKWSLSDIHTAILKKAGYEVVQANTKTVSGKSKILATMKLAFFGNEAGGGAEAERGHSDEIKKAPLELDPEDVNDIITALQSLNKYIVLEDFHYLTPEAQTDFAVALKAFHEESKLCFIIVGVWLEENRLTVYNGDLTGRVVSVDADKWQESELLQVITSGEELLNIQFDTTFKEDLLKCSFDSVYIIQESCFQCCEQENINFTQETNCVIGQGASAKDIVNAVVNQQTGRYNSFITQFASGFQETVLQMHKWLLYPVLMSDSLHLEDGLKWTELRNTLQKVHPTGKNLNLGNLTQALQSCAALQVKKEIKPIILDYDTTNVRLNVVDRGFINWLANQDKQSLLDLAGISSE